MKRSVGSTLYRDLCRKGSVLDDFKTLADSGLEHNDVLIATLSKYFRAQRAARHTQRPLSWLFMPLDDAPCCAYTSRKRPLAADYDNARSDQGASRLARLCCFLKPRTAEGTGRQRRHGKLLASIRRQRGGQEPQEMPPV